MPRGSLYRVALVWWIGLCAGRSPSVGEAPLRPMLHRNPGLTVDLGVGLWAWPLPMDYDGDGDLDLVVTCPDVPSNGTYFFENTSGKEPFPVFAPGKKIGPGPRNVSVSYWEGKPHVLVPATEYVGFLTDQFSKPKPLGLPVKVLPKTDRIRANQWKWVDFDGDGLRDLIVGVEEWSDYGWDDAFDRTGRWTRGPLHGYVVLLRNKGSNESPVYEAARQVEADGKPVDVYGMPSPNFADFDGDGDLDLLCGEFLDGFTYFENIGTRREPKYAAGRKLASQGKPLVMDLEMIVPTAIDWDGDGDIDLIVGQEDGRVALVEHTGSVVDGMPQFLPPRFFQQVADEVKFGALAAPFGFDWDGDGDDDLICGNTAGYVGFLENLGGDPPRWAAPKLLEADGKVLRIEAGPNGSIQGPCEARWGYTTLSVADWDGDSLPDLIVNSIWGKVVWYKNVGTRTAPKLAAARPIEVAWEGPAPKPAWNWWDPVGNELATQWRTTPIAIDFQKKGLTDLVMLDHEGYLALFPRVQRGEQRVLLPGQRIFVDEKGEPLRLNEGRAGKSGRRKLALVDWDGDGHLDLLRDSINVTVYRGRPLPGGKYELRVGSPLSTTKLAGHDTAPAIVDWNRDGIPDLVIGAEDGKFYFVPNPRTPKSGSEGAKSAR